MIDLYQAGELSPEQLQKALRFLETGEYDRSLEDFLSGKISLDLFKEIF